MLCILLTMRLRRYATGGGVRYCTREVRIPARERALPYKVWRRVRRPRLVGMVDESWLLSMTNAVRAVNKPNSDGTSPMNWLAYKALYTLCQAVMRGAAGISKKRRAHVCRARRAAVLAMRMALTKSRGE